MKRKLSFGLDLVFSHTYILCTHTHTHHRNFDSWKRAEMVKCPNPNQTDRIHRTYLNDSIGCAPKRSQEIRIRKREANHKKLCCIFVRVFFNRSTQWMLCKTTFFHSTGIGQRERERERASIKWDVKYIQIKTRGAMAATPPFIMISPNSIWKRRIGLRYWGRCHNCIRYTYKHLFGYSHAQMHAYLNQKKPTHQNQKSNSFRTREQTYTSIQVKRKSLAFRWIFTIINKTCFDFHWNRYSERLAVSVCVSVCIWEERKSNDIVPSNQAFMLSSANACTTS